MFIDDGFLIFIAFKLIHHSNKNNVDFVIQVLNRHQSHLATFLQLQSLDHMYSPGLGFYGKGVNVPC